MDIFVSYTHETSFVHVHQLIVDTFLKSGFIVDKEKKMHSIFLLCPYAWAFNDFVCKC